MENTRYQQYPVSNELAAVSKRESFLRVREVAQVNHK